MESASPNPAQASGRRWLVFLLCASLFICSQFFRVSNAIIAPEITADLNLSARQLGLLGAMFFYAFALAQLPLALFLDWVGARATMTALSLLAAVGAAVFATAQEPFQAAVGRALLGLGMAGNLMGSMKLFTRWFSAREFATISGMVFSLGTLGNMMAATPLALLVQAVGWRWAFVAIGALTAGLTALFFVFVRDDPSGISQRTTPAAAGGLNLRRNLGALFLSRDYWLISQGTFFRYGVFVAIQGLWIGPYLLEGAGMSKVDAGNLIILLNAGLIVGSTLGGWLSDRVLGSPKWVAVTSLTGLSLAVLCLSQGWLPGDYWLLGGLLFVMGLSSAFGVVMYAHIKEVMPPDMPGMALTGINFFTMVGGGIFLHLMGWVVETHAGDQAGGPAGFQAAFFTGFAGLALALVLYLFTSGRRRNAA